MGRATTLALAALALVVLPASAEGQPPERPTPALIERALDSGRIDLERANLLRLYALRGDPRLPAEYRGDRPWDGTLTVRSINRTLPRMDPGPERRAVTAALAAPPGDPNPTTCFESVTPMTNSFSSDHFYIQYNAAQLLDSELTIQDYAASLDAAWDAEVGVFGWAAPPIDAILAGRYHVRIDVLGPLVYGFVSNLGTYAGNAGDNPNTSWNDVDAQKTCMVLNEDYSLFPGSPRQALDATTAHEFNHSLQYGYGALNGPNAPDDNFVEGGATWMEDEVQDASNDNYNYLYPAFDDSMGEHDEGDIYAYWLTFRGLTERFGTGTAGGGEQVMQDFWERISQFGGEGMLTALNQALVNKGSSLPAAYHDYAVAAKPMRSCGGGFVLPFCFEEAAGYVAAAGATEPHGTIGSIGGSASGSVEDDYALNWVTLPTSGSYDLTVANTSAGGSLRTTVACDTGTAVATVPLPAPLGPAQSATIAGLDPSTCQRATAVITNEAQTAPNPDSSTARAYTVTTGPAPPSTVPTVTGGASGAASPPISARDTVAPLLSRIRLSRRRFRAFRSGAGISARRGTRVFYRLSERATVRIRLLRRRGRRWVTVRGSGIDRGVKGANSFRFSGRWRRKRLPVGVYRLRLQPKDGARNVGRVRTTRSLRIVRR